MEKEVLIHVKGLHMMDTPEGDEPIEIVVQESIISVMEAIIFAMKKCWTSREILL